MDYLAAFEISSSGLSVEKTRLDIMALNLANANSTRGADGKLFEPMRVVSGPKTADFANLFNGLQTPASDQLGVKIVDIKPVATQPKLVFDPNHPQANERGYVSYPNVNPVSEMVTMIEATRAYEANIKAINAAKSMAMRALEIGSSK